MFLASFNLFSVIFFHLLLNFLMQSVILVFPHQLFQNHPALEKAGEVILVEERLFFTELDFHKQKLILHRASMQFYKAWLEQKKYKVTYVEAGELHADVRKLIPWLKEKNCHSLRIANVTDDWLKRRLYAACKTSNIEINECATPMFLNDVADWNDYFDKKGYHQTDFYIQQRKQRNVLMMANNKPEGGKWSFDAANRKRFPKNGLLPQYHFPEENKYTKEAKQYIEKKFSGNYGNVDCTMQHRQANYPTTFTEAEKWLDDFLQNRFSHFGVYEDAIVKNENILFHSLLSPLLNIGLLTPDVVLKKALQASAGYQIQINALEGFVRQLIGWREYIHLVYEREGRRQRTQNFWGFTRKIPVTFWTGETGIEPVDNVIKKLLQCGYTHHIERLMIMGNFMLLCEFDPDEVYKWFMEMYIDSYDWVMVPNTYGMTQFSDGGLMMTKPYISGSNYLMKMGDYKKGEWQQIWDGLFWRFMHTQRHFFESNPRLSFLLRMWDKMPAEKRKLHLANANSFLHELDKYIEEKPADTKSTKAIKQQKKVLANEK